MQQRHTTKLKWCDFIRSRSFGDPTEPVCLYAQVPPMEELPAESVIIQAVRDHVRAAGGGELGRVECSDFIGRDYLAMEWKDRAHYWDAMEGLLRLGLSVGPQCRLSGQWFEPSQLPPLGTPWSRELAEIALVTKKRQEIGNPNAAPAYDFIIRGAPPYTHPNAWLTRDGREFAAWCCRRYRFKDEPSSSDEEIALPPAPPPQIRAVQRDVAAAAPADDDLMCVVCMAQTADTLVLPCQHQVCCRACAARLKGTPNATLCIVCRQHITDVLMDERA